VDLPALEATALYHPRVGEASDRRGRSKALEAATFVSGLLLLTVSGVITSQSPRHGWLVFLANLGLNAGTALVLAGLLVRVQRNISLRLDKAALAARHFEQRVEGQVAHLEAVVTRLADESAGSRVSDPPKPGDRQGSNASAAARLIVRAQFLQLPGLHFHPKACGPRRVPPLKGLCRLLAPAIALTAALAVGTVVAVVMTHRHPPAVPLSESDGPTAIAITSARGSTTGYVTSLRKAMDW